MVGKPLCILAALAVPASAQINIPTVPIGSPGNAADAINGFGSVAYEYRIGTYEVTNAQYAAFLNAKAASDVYSLYNPLMGAPDGDGILYGGIARSGTPGSYQYSLISGRESNPVNFVSFWDALRFTNWLHNGQGSGDTETGAYTLTPNGINANTITRNAGSRWALTSENEWYKAAYHQPASQGGDSDDYWLYPTSANSISASQANIYPGTGPYGNTSPVGSYTANFSGAFDMAGNVWEWTEAIFMFPPERGFRGGSFVSFETDLRATSRPRLRPEDEYTNLGFRVSQIPTPSAFGLLAFGGLVASRRRRG